MVKVGCTGVLILVAKLRLLALAEAVLTCTHSHCLEQNEDKHKNIQMKIFNCAAVEISVYCIDVFSSCFVAKSFKVKLSRKSPLFCDQISVSVQLVTLLFRSTTACTCTVMDAKLQIATPHTTRM